jgi:ribosomal-protein-alanine N-acetyltransferase
MASSSDRFPVLTTTRLRLRRIEPRDVDTLHACFSDPQAMRYWDVPPSANLADTRRMANWLGKTTSPYDHLAWAVADQADDLCIGMVNYHHREARNDRLEVGYILAPAQQRRGLMTEAMQALLAYCFEELAVHRVQALIHPDNAASIALAERLGFRCEGGPLRDYWRVGDGYMDVMLYALLAGERREA